MGAFHAFLGDTAPDDYPAGGQYQPEPMIEPGQIWLVECENASLSAFHVGLLARANVVLYDPALLAAVAEALPIGAYAEPLPASGAAESAIAPRALQFAADGWSVLQLVERRIGWRERLRSVTEELNRPVSGKSSLLAIGTITASRYRERRGPHTDLAIVTAELRPDELLSLTFAPPGASPGPSPGASTDLRRPAQGQVFTANGLAG